MCNSAQRIHESQNFAALLLENSNLISATFNDILIQVVTKSANRSSDDLTTLVNFPVNIFHDQKKKNALVTEALTNYKSTVGVTDNTRKFQDLIRTH